MANSICAVTEASDKFFHLTRVSVYSFIEHNRWFDGTLKLLVHQDLPLSERNLLILKLIYPTIEIISINSQTTNQIKKLASFRNSNKYIDLLFDTLKIFIFTIPATKILYFSNKCLFLNNVVDILVSGKIVSDENFSLAYIDGETNHIKLDIANIPPFEEVISSINSLNYTILPALSSYSANYPNAKFNNIVQSRLKNFPSIVFNTFTSESARYSKINQVWLHKNHEISNTLQKPSNIGKNFTANKVIPNRIINSNPTVKNSINKNKLGAVYIVFDGIELLEKSILQIRKHVDYINVIYQKVSWFNKPIKPEDLKILNSLKSLKLIDELTEFTAFKPRLDYSNNSIKESKKYETLKRQKGLLNCLNVGCTHHICMDVDEFYISSEFESAKKIIYSDNIDYSACNYINYVTPNLHRGLGEMHVPFICKINNSSSHGPSFITRVDSTRGITTKNILISKKIIFSPSIIKMHHMETVRINLYSKYESTSRLNLDRGRLHKLVEIVKTAKDSDANIINFEKIMNPGNSENTLIYVDNIFDINYQSW